MEYQFLIAAMGVAIGIVSWFMRLEQRLNAGLSREEHEKICQKTSEKMTRDLYEIKDLVSEHAQAAADFRDETTDKLAIIDKNVAVMVSENSAKQLKENSARLTVIDQNVASIVLENAKRLTIIDQNVANIVSANEKRKRVAQRSRK